MNLDHNSSVSDNTAIKSGGGIYNVVNSTVNLNDNSYISYNKAERGGGIFNDYYCMVNLNHGSIDHNNATSPSPSGGGIFNNFGTITGDTSIVHDNTPDQIAPIMWTGFRKYSCCRSIIGGDFVLPIFLIFSMPQ